MDVIVYRPPTTYHAPMPPRFRTRLYCESDWKVAAASATITNGYVYGGQIFTPFYNNNTTTNTLPYTFLGPATAATLQCTGATSLLNSALYLWYKVLRSTITVRLDPGPASNDFEVVVVPSISLTVPANIYSARTQPFAKSAKFSSTGSSTNRYLTSSLATNVALGITEAELKGDLAQTTGVFNSSASPLLAWVWQIWLQTADANVTVSASLLRVRVEYEVELLLRNSAFANT